MRPRPRRSSNAARPSSASGGCAIALSPTASRKPATACSPSHGCRQVSGEAREQRTRSSVCTKSSSGGSRRRPCCRRQKQQRCCSGRCSPLVRSTCARLMVGRRSPQSPSISRLTSPPDRILSKCRRSRHRIPTPLATAPALLLLLFTDVQVVLHNLNSGTDQHVFQWQHPFQETLIFTVRAETHHPFDARPVVQTAIEQDQLLRRRQIRDIALKVPGRAILVGRLAERHDPRLAWAEMLDDAFDRAVLSARIPALEYDQHPVSMLNDVALNFDQLDLKFPKQCFVAGTSIWISRFLGALRH